jgi:hypothetical protein
MARIVPGCHDPAVNGSDDDGLVEASYDSSRITVWIFQGERARHASGLFETVEDGLAWAAERGVTDILAGYTVGGAYDVAVREGRFSPARPHHGSEKHVAAFSPGLGHVYLVDGRPEG